MNKTDRLVDVGYGLILRYDRIEAIEAPEGEIDDYDIVPPKWEDGSRIRSTVVINRGVDLLRAPSPFHSSTLRDRIEEQIIERREALAPDAAVSRIYLDAEGNAEIHGSGAVDFVADPDGSG